MATIIPYLYVGCSTLLPLPPPAAEAEVREHVPERVCAAALLRPLEALLAEPVVCIPDDEHIESKSWVMVRVRVVVRVTLT